ESTTAEVIDLDRLVVELTIPASSLRTVAVVDAKFYPMIRELGLKIALTGSHGFQNAAVPPGLHSRRRGSVHVVRSPLVLCYLEGQTNEAAARKLGWPIGTIS